MGPDRLTPEPLMPAGVGGGATSAAAKPVATSAPMASTFSKPFARGPREPIPSDALFGGAREVQISHGGVLYRLKQTALGKLILTK